MNPDNTCFCAQLSRDAGEELFGTASTVDVWLLLEYSGRWGESALRESDLPPAVKARLTQWIELQPRTKLLLIKQRDRRSTGLRFYVALSREQNPVLYEFRLNQYEELLDLDIAAVVRERPEYRERLSSRPVFLVCTHGVHDKCCAKYGRPVYAALAQRPDLVVWQSSHVGGDRFAANVVCLPHGIYYGRVDRHKDVDAIVEACANGVIYLAAYRGRSCYSFAAQAAENYIREQTGVVAVDGLQLDGVRHAEGRWTVTFVSTADGLKHSVHVAREPMGVQNYLVCKAQGPSELFRFRLDTAP